MALAGRSNAASPLLWLVLACLLVSALLGRLCYLAQPFDSDAAVFIYMGKLVSEGGRVGRELIDNKFPTVGLLMSVPWRAFGANWTLYVISGWLLTAAASASLGRSVGRWFGRPQGWAAGLAALVFLNFHTAVYAGLMLETIHACFATLAAAAAIEALAGGDARDAGLVGLAAGLAGMAKPSGLAVFAAFIFAVFVSCRSIRRRLQLSGAALVGLSVPVAVVTTYLVAADNLRDMPALWRQIARYAADTSWNSSDWMKPVVVAALLGWPLLIRGWVFRRHRSSTPSTGAPRIAWEGNRGVVIFALLWLAAEAVGVVSQRRMYAYHFFVLGPPVALLFGLTPRRNSAACLAGSLLPIAAISSLASAAFLQRAIHQPATLAVSEYLNEHAHPGDALWRDDAPRLWLETGMRSGSRYPLTFLFANSDDAPLEYGRAMLDDFERIRPTWIILPRDLDAHLREQAESIVELQRSPLRRERYEDAWRRLADYTRSHYAVESVVRDEVIWRRKTDEVVQNN